MRSQRLITNFISCSIRRMEMPSSVRIRRIRPSNSFVSWGFIPAAGSSSKSRKGFVANAFRPPKFMVSCFISSTGSMSSPPGVVTVKDDGKDHGRFDKIETGGIDESGFGGKDYAHHIIYTQADTDN